MEKLFQVSWISAQDLARYEGKSCEATLADLTMKGNGICLTRNEILRDGNWAFREEARLCLHPLALWLAWNFYRLLYEPIPETRGQPLPLDWILAHDMANVGEGFIWPPLTIYSDGSRSALRPSVLEVESLDPVRYTGTVPLVLPAEIMKEQILDFLQQCRDRLVELGVDDSPFQEVFEELLEEIQNEDTLLWRKTEAMLGFDPDNAPQIIRDAFSTLVGYLGAENTTELAANGQNTFVPAEKMRDWIRVSGIERHPQKYLDIGHVAQNDAPAWVVATETARKLRSYLGIQGKVKNRYLADICGITMDAMDSGKQSSPSYQLTAYSEEDKRLALGVGRRTESRRFALARLLGEELLDKKDRQFSLITHSKTYRQKFQRAFAAEFLCPREEVQGWLTGREGDDETITDIAEFFGVSTFVITHALENSGRAGDPLDRPAA